MSSFFNTLGYDLTLQKASLQGENQQLYSISHTCDQLDGLPVHIVGFYDPSHPNKNTLDIRSSGGTSRLSPHSTIQEYLNVSNHLYAMATNGLILRLVRDSGRLVKMTYIEFDLKRLLEDDKYSEFTLLYRLLHASRFPKSKQDAEQCFLEKYYQDSIESGNRIREGLSDAVKESLVALGNGLLEHPENEELREKITSGRPDAREFYHQLLRLIYRLLFLMVTEERDLVFSDLKEENREPDMDDLLKGIKRPSRKQKEIYYNFYSLVRLRKLSQKQYLLESQYSDLWHGLMQAFALFESGGTGLKLGIQALGSELFSHNAMPDITSSKVNNRVLLKCIKSLNEFEDEKHNLSFINYRALDVEELGSVYEGLLELEPVFEWENGKPRFTFIKGSERSSSGSHYTPEDLVKPLIQHSLEYLIEDSVVDFYKGKVNNTETVKKLLDLKVCDVACGSGHILLSAARRIALEIARVETGEQQPNPASFRHSLKEVIKNCIYGVDKNPLAVELCKVALWLESHNPGEPLSFLDHRIKCGDAIVGLSNREELQNGIDNEAFKKLSGDDKNIASAFLKKNREERTLREKSGQTVQLTTETNHRLMEQVRELNRLTENFSTLPENSPEEIENKEKAYRILINSDSLRRLKIIADLQIMPFFIPKIVTNKHLLLTDSQFFRFLRGETHVSDIMEMQAMETGVNYRFFHWFLEFPEVFIQGGFSCIVGNPPYLGGTKISTNFGDYYQLFLKAYFRPIGGRADLIAYFVKRMFHLISNKAFLSIIATNSISQGETREGGLAQILKHQGKINFAVSSTPWPGKAAVEVSLLAITKRKDLSKLLLNGKQVENISSYLDNEITNIEPYKLIERENECFLGHYISGSGFVLTNEEASKIIHLGQKYKDVIFPYLNGQDLNSEVDQKATRSVIY
ncbi:MAG: restriction endonuclease, partial [Bacteroidales bacterium]|nr:restriction endonuclease [Bacteroidales bacterium]